jgi:glutamate formiminotransferase
MDRPSNPAEWGLKGVADFFTEVDRESERAIVETLLDATPDATVMGEELTPSAERAPLVWVVDPVDGTTNYLHAYPAYAVSIAAVTDGALAVGVVIDVERDLLYHATAGGGAWCGDRRIQVSGVTDPKRALIGTGFPFKVPQLLPRYLRHFTTILTATSGLRRAGSAALDLIDVGLGRFDGFWELHLAPWDVAAGTLFVREAGGVVTDDTGNDDVIHHGPIVAGNRNFSEGRAAAPLEALEDAIRSVTGAHLLDAHTDASHHRSVLTIVGQPQPVLEAAFRATATAARSIDLRKHRGAHPRIGATDVIPFVPLGDATMDVCIQLANELGARIGHELEIPVYLYGVAARHPARVRLAALRRPQFEGLRDRIGVDPAWKPDFGPDRIHPTAGATAVGARPVLVAYNVLLDSDDVHLAEAIARAVRASSGGLPAVQARGFLVSGKAQVSMNLLDIDVTPPTVVFEAVKRRATECGRAILRSEIVGLVPERAVPADSERYLRLDAPVETHLLERRIAEEVPNAEQSTTSQGDER